MNNNYCNCVPRTELKIQFIVIAVIKITISMFKRNENEKNILFPVNMNPSGVNREISPIVLQFGALEGIPTKRKTTKT